MLLVIEKVDKGQVRNRRFNFGCRLLLWLLLLRLLVEYHCVLYITREADLIQDVVLKRVVLAIKQESNISSGDTVN